MKILLVCAGGMSTSILMNKMKTYAKDQGEELEIAAVGLSQYNEVFQNYDIILVGPQVAYRLDAICNDTGIPCAAIPSLDYALADCQNIFGLAKKIYKEK